MKLLKAVLMVLAVEIILVFGFPGVVQAETNKISVKIDGEELKFSSPIFNIDGTIMVPLKETAYALGAAVKEDEKSFDVRCVKEQLAIVLGINNNTALVNGVITQMPQAFHIINDTYYISLRFLAETLGNNVAWNNGTVSIASGPIAFIGDSLTQYFPFDQYLPGMNLVNKGIAGNLTFDVVPRAGELKGLKPRKIFLMIGTNDMWCAIDKSLVLRNYRTILSTFIKDEPWAKIYIQSIMPVGQAALDKNNKASNPAIVDMNMELQKLAAEFNIQYVDIASGYKDDKGRLGSEYTADGIHLKKESYDKWADKVKELIKGFK